MDLITFNKIICGSTGEPRIYMEFHDCNKWCRGLRCPFHSCCEMKQFKLLIINNQKVPRETLFNTIDVIGPN